MQILDDSRELADGEVILRVGNGAHISAKAVGRVRLDFNKKFIILNNVYFIPDCPRNLISLSLLHEQCYDIEFINNEIIISKYGTSKCCAKPDNGLYVHKPNEQSILNNEFSKDDETYLWHLCFGHRGLDRREGRDL